jgi:hypothetical protein
MLCESVRGEGVEPGLPRALTSLTSRHWFPGRPAAGCRGFPQLTSLTPLVSYPWLPWLPWRPAPDFTGAPPLTAVAAYPWTSQTSCPLASLSCPWATLQLS